MRAGCVLLPGCVQFQTDPRLEQSVMKWGREALSDLGYLQADEHYEQVQLDFSKR
jgi:hypothetical protein